MDFTIVLRRDTAADWTSDNPVLHQGEVGIETDTSKAKLGDGVTPWNSLAYWNTGGGAGGGDKNYVQAFSASSVVSVPHDLGKYPAVTIMDSAGDEVMGDVDHININNLTLTFSAPFSGTVTCN